MPDSGSGGPWAHLQEACFSELWKDGSVESEAPGRKSPFLWHSLGTLRIISLTLTAHLPFLFY